jgi:hypothetical protein
MQLMAAMQRLPRRYPSWPSMATPLSWSDFGTMVVHRTDACATALMMSGSVAYVKVIARSEIARGSHDDLGSAS